MDYTCIFFGVLFTIAGFVFALVVILPWVSLLLSLPAMLSCEVRVSPYHPTARRGETSWWLLDVGNRRRMPMARVSLQMQMRNCMTGDGRRAKLKLSGGSQGLHLAEPADLVHCGRLDFKSNHGPQSRMWPAWVLPTSAPTFQTVRRQHQVHPQSSQQWLLVNPDKSSAHTQSTMVESECM